MPLTVTVESFGEAVIERQLLRFADHVAVPVVALQAAATVLREATEAQFDTEGGYASGGWPPLAASTVAEKARKDLDPRILRATGALFESLTRKFDSRHIEVVSPSGESLRFGTTVPYGIYHASSAPRHRIPYRPPVALTEADKVRIVREMQAAILVASGREVGVL